MKRLEIELYWSFRSPYCYLAMDRLFELPKRMNVAIQLRHVWPGAMRQAGYFKTLHPNYPGYHALDSLRTAEFHGISYARPVPDPLVFDQQTYEPIAEQPYIRRLTRLALAAREMGNEHVYLCSLMRLLWNGDVKGWDQGDHLEQVATAAGLDFDELSRIAQDKAEILDQEVSDNGIRLERVGHWGVPCAVLDGEPFFGQDRIDMLIWRLGQRGAIET